MFFDTLTQNFNSLALGGSLVLGIGLFSAFVVIRTFLTKGHDMGDGTTQYRGRDAKNIVNLVPLSLLLVPLGACLLKMGFGS